MKEGTENTLKFKKLKRRLQMPEWQVIGILEAIWKLGRTSAQDGHIGKYSNEDIAAHLEYAGDADELISALVETGWIVEDKQFRLYFNDWSEHVPTYLKGNFAKHKRKFVDQIVKERDGRPIIEKADDRPDEELRRRVLNRDQVCQYCGGEPETIDHVVPKIRGGEHTESNLVASCLSCNDIKGTLSVEDFAKQPNAPPFLVLGIENGTANDLLSRVLPSQVKPSPVKPSQSKSSPRADCRAGPDVDRVRSLANKLLRQKKIDIALTPEEVWRVAWVAAVVDETVVTRIVSAFTGRRIGKPKGYVMKAMKTCCEENGRNWAELCAQVGAMPTMTEVVR